MPRNRSQGQPNGLFKLVQDFFGRDPAPVQPNVSAPYRTERRAELKFRSGLEIQNTTPVEQDWLVKPWVSRSSTTELNGKAKEAGKTTFAMSLALSVISGGEFLGEKANRSPVVYLTEQQDTSLREEMKKTGLLGNPDFHVLQWHMTPGNSWEAVVDAAVAQCHLVGARLLVVDTLPQFAGLVGDQENDAGAALKAMQPLQLAASRGLGVLVIRHERKSGGGVADAGRGSSAFTAAVDTVLILRVPEGNRRPTIRQLEGISRIAELPEQLFIELTDRGYVSLGTNSQVALKEAENSIHGLLLNKGAQTIEEITQEESVSRTTAQRAIDQLVSDGIAEKIGAGKRGDPHRYRLIQSAPSPIPERAETNETVGSENWREEA